MRCDDNTVVHHHVSCLVSAAESGGHCNDDDEDEDGQTDGDPKLLLHCNKDNFQLAHKLIPVR